MNKIEQLVNKMEHIASEKQRILSEESDLKAEMLLMMQNQKIDKLSTSVIKINYVGGFIRKGVDADRLKKKYPEVAKDCLKESKVDPFLKVTVL